MIVMLKNMLALNITYHVLVKQSIRCQTYYQNNMENLIETIEKFLAYSDEKLEELAKENQKLREENHQSIKTNEKEKPMKKLFAVMLIPFS